MAVILEGIMKKRKKVNPNRIPVNLKDLEKARKQATDYAINVVWSIFFTVMSDKEGYGKIRLQRLWKEVNDLSDSIANGYVSYSDLRKTLEEEYDIYLKDIS